MSHFIEKCTCGKVLTQCRCMDPNKEVRIKKNGCASCQKRAAEQADTAPPASNVIDLGDGRCLRPFTFIDGGPTVGYVEEHPDTRDPSKVCAGAVYLTWDRPNPPPLWTVEQAAPLTLSPSILCRTCGNHGFVRDGKWVPA